MPPPIGILVNNPAVLLTGSVTITGNDGRVEADDTPTIWTDEIINNRYEQDGHTYMMGITSPDGFQGNKAAFCQLASPTLLWISDWSFARFGAQPIIPDPTPADPNWVLLDVIPETAIIKIAGDGNTPLYRISGTYVYGCKNPPANVFEKVVYGRAPWLSDTLPNGRNQPTALLRQNLINFVGGPNQQGGLQGIMIKPGAGK